MFETIVGYIGSAILGAAGGAFAHSIGTRTKMQLLEEKVSAVELRTAQDYVTRTELGNIINRMESHMVRIENKLDTIATKHNG
jgi:hypothetical protein